MQNITHIHKRENDEIRVRGRAGSARVEFFDNFRHLVVPLLRVVVVMVTVLSARIHATNRVGEWKLERF